MSIFSVEINELKNEPFIQIFCYPTKDSVEASKRVDELKRLGVEKVIFEGITKIGKLNLLGKGCVSLVVKAEKKGKLYALKIRRIDANRPDMKRETYLTGLANKLGVGPNIHQSSNNFLLMDLIEGVSIIEWIKNLTGKGTTSKLREVIKNVLTQCYKLDKAGLDHGELSNLEKHVYVGKKVTIIDFETASLNRRVSNLTSAAQNIFIGGAQSRKVRRTLRNKEILKIIDIVSVYKKDKTRENFQNILIQLKLE